MHDPWSRHPELSCPSCKETGKVVQDEGEAYDEFESPFVCCACGQAWRDAGMVGDVKEYRVQYMRLVEQRPYEPPKPKEPTKSELDERLKAYDSVLKDYYRAEGHAFESRAYALTMNTWSRPAGTITMQEVDLDESSPIAFKKTSNGWASFGDWAKFLSDDEDPAE